MGANNDPASAGCGWRVPGDVGLSGRVEEVGWCEYKIESWKAPSFCPMEVSRLRALTDPNPTQKRKSMERAEKERPLVFCFQFLAKDSNLVVR